MYILAVETTGPLCSVALLEKNKILAVRSSKEQKNHLKDLMPLIKDLMDSVQIHKSKLNYIAASIGPGSFTGIRIGVATARALAQVLDIPAVAVPTLDAFCCCLLYTSKNIHKIFDNRSAKTWGNYYAHKCRRCFPKSGIC